MNEEFRPIRPKVVPLTHSADPSAADAGYGRAVRIAVILLAIVIVVVSFLGVPALLPDRALDAARATAPTAQPGTTDASETSESQPIPAGTSDAPLDVGRGANNGPGVAPYAARSKEEERSAAQRALERFVELELALKNTFTLGDWSEPGYTAAREDAARGDDAFMNDRFTAAAEAYAAGAARLETLQSEAKRRLDTGLADGASALSARDAAAAAQAFALAATVAPNDPAVVAGLQRASRLPEVNSALRAARNHELAEDWDQALAALASARALDPATDGLAEIEERLRAALGNAELESALSRAFAALDRGDDAAARAAFTDALQLDPGNTSARGGLEALARDSVRRQLARLEAEGEAAFREERWDTALEHYQAALKLDPNVAFAVTGRDEVLLRQRALSAIQRVLDDRNRLSSASVVKEAEAVLATAQAIKPMSPGLEARIRELADTLERYATPVTVTLRSDNATQVTLSSVGALGTFTERILELRPGAYTVLGSRDGCRDVRTRVVVRADMPPIDIRCTETL
ncbi:MAG: tetratricopeptide repeat protein [Pseudomonadales bacterium]